MSENRTNGSERTDATANGTDDRTMNDVSHTHPYTGETFGTVYRRGPAVADGGSEARSASKVSGESASAAASSRDATDGGSEARNVAGGEGPTADAGRTGDRDAANDAMADVEHTAPHGEGANEVWKRGPRSADVSERRGGDVDE